MSAQEIAHKYGADVNTAPRCYLRYRRQGWCREAARTLASRDADTLTRSLTVFLLAERKGGQS